MSGFHPSGYILQARTMRQTNLWGPFKNAEEAARWATAHIESGSGQWIIRPLWDPNRVDKED
jgi:glucan biosynthesis protein